MTAVVTAAGITERAADSGSGACEEEIMSEQTRAAHPIYNLLPAEIEGFHPLAELALNMRWSWNHATDEVWRKLDPELWEITHNPWVVLQTVSRDRIEREVIPEFHTRNGSGIPTAWVKRMRASMARLTPRFCVNRTVREYTEAHYLPAASAYRERAADQGAAGLRVAKWRRTLDEKWATLHFGEVKAEIRGDQHVFEVQVHLADLDPEAVRVELYADAVMGGAPVRQEMKRVLQRTGASGDYVYGAAVSAARPPSDYTARVIPHCDGVAIPLEDARILWRR